MNWFVWLLRSKGREELLSCFRLSLFSRSVRLRPQPITHHSKRRQLNNTTLRASKRNSTLSLASERRPRKRDLLCLPAWLTAAGLRPWGGAALTPLHWRQVDWNQLACRSAAFVCSLCCLLLQWLLSLVRSSFLWASCLGLAPANNPPKRRATEPTKINPTAAYKGSPPLNNKFISFHLISLKQNQIPFINLLLSTGQPMYDNTVII